MIDVLGFPLSVALEKLKENGIEGQMIITSAPKKHIEEQNNRNGELRVVAQRGNILICAEFLTGLPKEESHE